jgi:hypothetical protein
MSQNRIDALSRSLADGTSRRSLLRMLGIGVAGTALAGTAGSRIALDDAQAKTFSKLKNIPIKERDGDKRFRGRLSVLEFKQVGPGIVAVAKLTGTVTEDGDKKRVSRKINVPVSFPGVAGLQAQATCEILDLVLGPIDLRLLGLRLQVSRIRIRLTATQGGGLLGDLLCAIANLLNGGNVLGQLSQIVNLLNQILAAL